MWIGEGVAGFGRFIVAVDGRVGEGCCPSVPLAQVIFDTGERFSSQDMDGLRKRRADSKCLDDADATCLRRKRQIER